jgi:hypothetical protein
MNTKPATHVRAAFTKDGECKVSARNREFESVQSESRLAAGSDRGKQLFTERKIPPRP